MARILGIETSCDETAASVVEDGKLIISNVVASQIELHRRYGGVFPEMASRQHVLAIVPVIQEALEKAGVKGEELDAIAVTHGPGLAGSLLVGVNAAKALAWAWKLPLLGINHLEGHIYANWLLVGEDSAPPEVFPLLCLVVSGGHTSLFLMNGHGRYRELGRTLDDAAGEAFDKVGRLLGLPYPGGPAIEKAAEWGDPTAFKLPRAWLRGTYNFSFSGLKTAVLRLTEKPEVKKAIRTRSPLFKDLAASFQEAVVDVLVEKTRRAAEEYGVKGVLLAGGVAANTALRRRMRDRLPCPLSCPPPYLCTDNAAMIAAAGYYHLREGWRDGWDLDVVPNLSLGTS